MIKVSVNGELKNISVDLNIHQLIEVLAYKTKGFAVAVNMIFIPIAKYEETSIKEGDKIDILAPVQGG
jgi:sulfur carrier protein